MKPIQSVIAVGRVNALDGLALYLHLFQHPAK